MTEEASTYNGLKIIYSINAVGKIGQIYAEKIKLDHLLIPQTIIHLKCLKGLNVRPEIIEILEENISSKISDIVCRNFFIRYISPDKGNKRKNKQMGLHKTKKKLHCKGNHQ